MKRFQVHQLVAALAIFFLFGPFAHSTDRPVPENVDVRVFARVESGRLELLVRVPLDAVKNIQSSARATDGYLDLTALQTGLRGMSQDWIAQCFEVDENGVPVTNPKIVAVQISANSDHSFNSYAEAFAHLHGPGLPPQAQVVSDQVWLDIQSDYSLRSDRPRIAIRPKVAGLGVQVWTDMKYMGPDGVVRNFSFPSDPGLIYLDARWLDAANQFVLWGFRSVLGNSDLLLFLLCLTLPLRHYRNIFPAVTLFAITFSFALLSTKIGFNPDTIWFHPLIETLSALAVLWTALANIVGRVTAGRRALLALCSGFVYGFARSFDLDEKIQFDGFHNLISALSYDIGAVFAVVFAIILLIPILSFLFSFARTERVELIIASALAADTAWGWLDMRWSGLSKIPFHALMVDTSLLVLTLRLLTVFVLLGGLLWFADGWAQRFAVDDSPRKNNGKAAT